MVCLVRLVMVSWSMENHIRSTFDFKIIKYFTTKRIHPHIGLMHNIDRLRPDVHLTSHGEQSADILTCRQSAVK